MIRDRILNVLPVSVRSAWAEATFLFYRPVMARFFSQFIAKNDLIFDVGANIGHFTQVFSDLGARIIAIDPQPYCAEALKRKFSANPDITILAVGTGSKNGVESFYISSHNHATSTFSEEFIKNGRFAHRTWDRVIRVPVVTLDWLIETYGRPAFIKIDAEGYEMEVIKGLSTSVPYLSFEFSGEFPETTTTAVQYLSALGRAEFNYSAHEMFTLHSWVSADQLTRAFSEKRRRYFGGDIYCRMC